MTSGNSWEKRQVCGIVKIEIGTQLFEVKLCAACRTQQVVRAECARTPDELSWVRGRITFQRRVGPLRCTELGSGKMYDLVYRTTP